MSEQILVKENEIPYVPKILVITTQNCSYQGVDNCGQQHLSYPPNSYVLNVPDPVLLPERFYINSFKKGIDGIIVMSCGEETPYDGAFETLSLRINDLMKKIKNDLGIEPQRLKLTAICTVCAKHVKKEITQMDAYLRTLKPIKQMLNN